jgi:hypothetical protein
MPLRRPARPLLRSLLLAVVALPTVMPGCKACREDEAEEEEEREQQRDHFWRAQIAIVGKGTVRTFVEAFDCRSDGAVQTGDCGPKLVRFKELKPPTMEAIPAPGWKLDHWESSIREPDGSVAPRKGRMPDGRVYLNGFGYADTGELETVKPIFVPSLDGGPDGG